jgi:predicted alpha/beta superfamily hydrolase
MTRKRKISYLIGGTLLMLGCYFIYSKIMQQIEEKKHKEWVKTLTHSASKNVQILTDTITIDYLNEKRTIALYLPENYKSDTNSYSVIYFFDGHAQFDQKIQEGNEWQVDEVLDSLGRQKQAQSIVVGIYCSKKDRMTEYKPFPSSRWYSDKVVSGDRHAEWIVKGLKPWIDARYRTKKDPNSTIIGGASLGGLMAYYMLMHYPEVFGKGIVFSPSFWVNECVYKLHETNKHLLEQKIYFNAGSIEKPTVEGIQEMQQTLLKYGMPKENIKLDIEEGEGHRAMTWRKGFKKAYPWIIEGN